MADLASSLSAVPQKKELLHQAFDELEAHGAAIARSITRWKELDQHFSDIAADLQKRFDEIVAREKAFEAHTKEVQAVLDKRDEAVSTREQASLARVQEQKDAAIATILEQKRKWNEERQRLESEATSAAVAKSTTTAQVPIKAEAEAKPETDKAEKESVAQAMDVKEEETKPTNEDDDNEEAAAETKEAMEDNKDAPKTEPKARPQLKSLCENMDGAGLRKYVAEQKKEISILRAELPSALRCAIDPSRVVLKALEGYHSTEPLPAHGKHKPAGPPNNRRACILLLEALADVLADPLLGTDQPVVPPNIKVSAKEVADLWKSTLTLEDAKDAVALLDAQSFLQLLATFGLASEFDEDELCKLVVFISRRKQTPALCRSLGLAAKVPDVVEKLIKDGKQIEALSFAHEFELFEQFPPVPLLKAHLKEVRKATQASSKGGNQSFAAQSENLMKELSALRAVLKCIDEYKLEAQFSPENLQKRVAQLEKTKSEKKRTADVAKFQSKKPRANGAGGGPHGGPGFRSSDRPQYGGGGVSPYGLAAHNYGSGYGGGARSPRSLAGAYSYPAEGMGALYSNPSFSYGSYQYGQGPPSAYQGSFFR